MADDKKKPVKAETKKDFDPTKEDFLPVRKIVKVLQDDGSINYKYYYDKVPGEDGYSEDVNSQIYTADEHKMKQSKGSGQYSDRAVKYLEKTKGSVGRDVDKPKAPTYNPSDKSYTFTK
jgi:hypothetical protein